MVKMVDKAKIIIYKHRLGAKFLLNISFPLKGSMFLVGCSMGFIEHYWYCWLDRMYVGRTMKAVAKKVLVDQIICAPSIGLWYFLGENYDCHHSACLLSPRLFTHTHTHLNISKFVCHKFGSEYSESAQSFF